MVLEREENVRVPVAKQLGTKLQPRQKKHCSNSAIEWWTSSIRVDVKIHITDLFLCIFIKFNTGSRDWRNDSKRDQLWDIKPALITINPDLVGCTKAGRWGRRRRQLQLLINVLQKLGAAWQGLDCNSNQKDIIGLFGALVSSIKYWLIPDRVSSSVTYHLRYGAMELAEDGLTFSQERRRKPLRHDGFTRISIRQAIGTIKKFEELPLPTKLKSFIQATFTAQLTFRVTYRDCWKDLTISKQYLDRLYSTVFLFCFIRHLESSRLLNLSARPRPARHNESKFASI